MATGKTKLFPILEAERTVIKITNELRGYTKIKVCGSIRRQKLQVGDIDIVVCPDGDSSTLIDSIHELGDRVLASGTKLVRVMVGKIQADFYLCEERLYGSHVLFLTGSKWFNIKCRASAKNMGYRLSQYGLLDGEGKEIAVDENDILEALSLQRFMNPSTR